MRSAVLLRHIVGKAQHTFVICFRPLHSDIDLHTVLFAGNADNTFMQRSFRFIQVRNKRLQSAFIMKNRFLRLIAAIINQFQINAGVQKSLLTDRTFQNVIAEFRLCKCFRRRQKRNFCPVASRRRAGNMNMLHDITVCKFGFILLVIAPNLQPQPYRQGIDYRHPHPVQTAGNLI